MPVLLDQTVGGMISTGSHGSSLKYGTTSDFVVGLRLVLPDGFVKELAEEDDDGLGGREGDKTKGEGGKARERERDSKLLKAARLGLGRLGIITEITFKVLFQLSTHFRASPKPQAKNLNSLAILNPKR